MKNKIVSLSKNEDFKSILSGNKISNKYLTIFFKKLSDKNNNKLNISFVAKKKIGNKGFGYDPIFIPENKRLTFGQMSQKLKFKNDHRAKAFKKIKKFL